MLFIIPTANVFCLCIIFRFICSVTVQIFILGTTILHSYQLFFLFLRSNLIFCSLINCLLSLLTLKIIFSYLSEFRISFPYLINLGTFLFQIKIKRFKIVELSTKLFNTISTPRNLYS